MVCGERTKYGCALIAVDRRCVVQPYFSAILGVVQVPETPKVVYNNAGEFVHSLDASTYRDSYIYICIYGERFYIGEGRCARRRRLKSPRCVTTCHRRGTRSDLHPLRCIPPSRNERRKDIGGYRERRIIYDIYYKRDGHGCWSSLTLQAAYT